MDEVSVEPASVDEADEVAELWVSLAAGQREFGSHLLADENRAVARDAVARHAVTGGIRVARDGDGEVVGFVTFGPESGSYEQDAARAVIHNLYVRPGAREEGVGSRLLVAAEDALASEGADVVCLEVMADNEDARAFYARHGYAEHRLELEKALAPESDTDSREDG